MATPRQAFLMLGGFGLAILLAPAGIAGHDVWRGESHRSRGKLKGYDRIVRSERPEEVWRGIKQTLGVGFGAGFIGLGAFVLWINRGSEKQRP